ncbi:hypothetical protein H6P81_020477 [Aristolochia fimbriata]|uniref:Uncharacterized protein n=1 Tax=Aristolochia fimbriata TaxID=158543 RepID=A0AAV7DXS4_ARIFI|nr:hypothetical protein H6P81_020477 [Aristolochia fimbriata]
MSERGIQGFSLFPPSRVNYDQHRPSSTTNACRRLPKRSGDNQGTPTTRNARATGDDERRKGFQMARLSNAQKFLKKIGLGKEDLPFWKQIGKALLCTYTVFGLAWLWNETSPLGWWTLKPRPKEEKEMAHLYERRRFPYPGDEEAVEKFIASGGTLGTTIGPKGFIDSDKDSENFQKKLQSQKFDQEAHKLWIRMRNEVLLELQEKGYDIEYLMRPPQRGEDQ